MYGFGPFRVDAGRGVLLRGDEPVPLTGKCFETLLVLIQHSDETVSKDVLMKTVWPDTFVEESNLTQHISMLRKALGESPQDRRYIVTVPGQGYRFVAEVREVAELPAGKRESESDVATLSDPRTVAPAPLTPPETSVTRRLAILAVVVLVILVVAVAYLWPRHESNNPSSTDSASIAVLPFVDLSHSKDEEYFSDGLSEELINHLARVPGLKVVARSSAFQFKGKNEDLRLVGQRLGVANLLEGSVRREGNRVRITTDLIKADDGFQLWSQAYDRQTGDIFAIQDEIAQSVTKVLRVKLLAFSGEAMPPSRGTDAEAYQAYLQGEYFFSRGEDKADLDKALGYAEQAIKLDKQYAPARALRSYVLNTMATIGLLPRRKGFEEARRDAEEAVALDPNLAAGYVAVAWVALNYDWDWGVAETSLGKAALLEPGSVIVLSYRSYLYEALGRLDEAIALTERATVLDPLPSLLFPRDSIF